MSDSFQLHTPPAPAGSKPRRALLVTGATGRIGSYFARTASEAHDLTLMAHPGAETTEIDALGSVRRAELADLDAVKALCEGIDTVVHLAADPSPSATWESVAANNITGTYNVMVAAVAAGCRRVVFASSIHAVSGYPPGRQVQADDPVSPGDLYGVSKCFGEAMGRFVATQHGLSVICIRIGAFQPLQAARDPDNVGLMNAFVSRRDLDQLIHRCVDDERVRFAIVHGLSDNAFNRMNTIEAKELLGYRPEDDFSRENPRLAGLELDERVTPHSEAGGQRTGIRRDL
jgi:NAD(P)-dependent dehydrogenase (short-subunit alcohol dehydrogenase family)